MMKRLKKIANGNRAVFKSKRSSHMNKLTHVKDVYSNRHELIGFFNLLDNVAEMTSEIGVAMGGSYHESNADQNFQKTYAYHGPQAYIGLRCVFEIID